MDNCKKKILLQSRGTNRQSAVLKPSFFSDFQQRTSLVEGDCEEIKENCDCFHPGTGSNLHNPKKEAKNCMARTISAASKAALPRKKILAERTEAFGSSFPETQMEKCPKNGREDAHLENSPDPLVLLSQITPSSLKVSESGYGSDSTSTYLPYDPLTNYLSPRPQFLRYKPNRRLEKLLQRQRRLRSGEEESCCCVQSQKSIEEKVLNGSSSQHRTEEQAGSYSKSNLKPIHNQEIEESEEGDDDDVYDEEKEKRFWHSNRVLKFLIPIAILFVAAFYISSLSSNLPAAVPHLQSLQNSREGHSTLQEALFQYADNARLGADKILETLEQFSNTNGQSEINGKLLFLDDHNDSIEEEGETVVKTEDSDDDLFSSGDEEEPPLFGRKEQVQANEQSLMEETGTTSDKGSKEEVGEQGMVGTREATEISTVQDGETSEISESLQAPLTPYLADMFHQVYSCSPDEKEVLEIIEIVSDEGTRRVEIGEVETIKTSGISDPIYGISEQEAETSIFSESLQEPEIQSAKDSALPDSPSASETELNSGKEDVSLSRTAIILSLISVLASLGAMALCLLKGRKASASVSSSPSCKQLPFKFSIVEDNVLPFVGQEQVLEKGRFLFPEKEHALEKGDSCANPLYLGHPNDNHNEFYGTCPPAVKLLGEYAYGEIRITEKIADQNVKAGNEEGKCSQFHEIERSTRKSQQSSTHNLSTSEFSTAESPLDGRSFASQDKLMRNEESSDGGGEGTHCNAAVRKRRGEIVTPVRRSSRIRNRVMSP